MIKRAVQSVVSGFMFMKLQGMGLGGGKTVELGGNTEVPWSRKQDLVTSNFFFHQILCVDNKLELRTPWQMREGPCH